ncbi:hypothetical protein N7281_03975 [Rickettsia hoogstraalii]|uniref:hypothetical protein n=1 Tax=Rickettsia hoogstraalii TaxID=467174 RepID=UPI0022517670|nr:hypothetical protein [Rickettsia hoogstraalii]MCX4084020.1 hypothetical protein [Rickettsia hoogstraalii]
MKKYFLRFLPILFILFTGTKYDLNFENLDLNITFPAEKMQPQSFDASGSPMQNVDTKLISGAYLNYDI